MLHPGVKSFLHGEKSIAVCGIKSILNLISHDKSASSTNQADLFCFILQREDQVKHILRYQERRFTKLRYTATWIFDAIPYLQVLVRESHLANQHIEIVCMFLYCEFFITELFALAYFTHKVSLPLLNFVEICPQLYVSLIDGKMDNIETVFSWI